MPVLRAFRGIRYTSQDSIADLVCPPYDVISVEQQAALKARHPNNAVNLELPKVAGGTADDYRAAGELMHRWLEEAVLARDPEARLYVYRQDFVDASGQRRRVVGAMGALALEPLGEGSVLPHERTMPGPKKDRLALLEACPVNLSPIYAIYRGAGALADFYENLKQRPTDFRLTDDAGTLHRLWSITQAAEVELLSNALTEGPLVIADGHHRYETALEYHRLHAGDEGEHDAILCFCVDADVEELVVLPYHRALSVAGGADRLRTALAGRADVRAVERGELAATLDSSKADHPLGFVLRDAAFIVELDASEVRAKLGDRAEAWLALDVVALHDHLLPELLGSDTPDFEFSRDPDHIIGLVHRGARDAGILMRALSPVEVVEVAKSGERMPQKASYFSPKALTGLVFRPLS